ncbi:MAG TPA: IS481 family transposase [Acidimicrobiales bacterium]|nr:IS481 family transposase [Acidimicrobiales bacterium]
MPWQEASTMSERLGFVTLACAPGSNRAELCRRFGIERATGYKWTERFEQEGPAGLTDRSRRPKHSPNRTAGAIEQEVLAVRGAHPAWGARKIRHVLMRRGITAPACSTITEILRRHGRIEPEESVKHKAFVRFERPHPNELWQMDFKGWVQTEEGRCHPLVVLDDHSRYALLVRACPDQTTRRVRDLLIGTFREYGLPERILTDNGSPWGTSDAGHRYTPLTVWLLRLEVGVSHGRPRHPQTQGKEERFNRTLKAETLREVPATYAACQTTFDRWRPMYNHERPHEALGMATPSSRYRPSARAYPERFAALEYPAGDAVRVVGMHGRLSYRNQIWQVPRAFVGERVALRATQDDGMLGVYYCREQIARVDLRAGGKTRPPRCRTPLAALAPSGTAAERSV